MTTFEYVIFGYSIRSNIFLTCFGLFLYIIISFALLAYFFKSNNFLPFIYRCIKVIIMSVIALYCWITLANLRHVMTKILIFNIRKFAIDKNLSIYNELFAVIIIILCASIYSFCMFYMFSFIKSCLYYIYMTHFHNYSWACFLSTYERYEITPLEKIITFIYSEKSFIFDDRLSIVYIVLACKAIFYPFYLTIFIIWCLQFYTLMAECFEFPNLKSIFGFVVAMIFSSLAYSRIIVSYIVFFLLLLFIFFFFYSFVMLIHYRIYLVPLNPYIF